MRHWRAQIWAMPNQPAHAVDRSTAPLGAALFRPLMRISLGVTKEARVELNYLGVLRTEKVTG